MVVEGSENEWIRKMAQISERWPLAHFEIRGVNLEQIFLQMYGGDSPENRAGDRDGPGEECSGGPGRAGDSRP